MSSSPPIDRTQVLHIARLARLKLAEDEIEPMTRQLVRIVDYMADLQELDVSKVQATEHVHLDRLALRTDEVTHSLERDTVMDQAPKVEEGTFVVPPFIDES